MAELDTGVCRSKGGVPVEESFAVAPQADSHSACVRWSIPNFSGLTSKSTRCLWSKYFDVGGYDCRVLVYPAGLALLWQSIKACQQAPVSEDRAQLLHLQCLQDITEGCTDYTLARPITSAGQVVQLWVYRWSQLMAGTCCAGDSQAVKGYVSIYVQVTDPKNAPKWDCFAAHRLSIKHSSDPGKSLSRDSWHRFSSKKKSHGWCEFAPVSSILDPRQVSLAHTACCCGFSPGAGDTGLMCAACRALP